MTTRIDGPKGFEARLLNALTEIDAARPAAPSELSPARGPRTRRVRWPVAITVAALTLAAGGTAVASASGLFESAPPAVQHILGGLDAHAASVDAPKATSPTPPLPPTAGSACTSQRTRAAARPAGHASGAVRQATRPCSA